MTKNKLKNGGGKLRLKGIVKRRKK